MFRSTKVLAVVFLAAGTLLGYAAATSHSWLNWSAEAAPLESKAPSGPGGAASKTRPECRKQGDQQDSQQAQHDEPNFRTAASRHRQPGAPQRTA